MKQMEDRIYSIYDDLPIFYVTFHIIISFLKPKNKIIYIQFCAKVLDNR